MPDHPTQRTVLLVEDDPSVRETTADLLSLTDARVLVADCGHAGAQILETEPVDLVVTDMIMPNGDGRWLLAFIRDTERLSRLPVIVLSALAHGDEVESGLAAGADAYLTKPFDPEKLLETIARLLPPLPDNR
jgi:CheY-like chemotaxis protein